MISINQLSHREALKIIEVLGNELEGRQAGAAVAVVDTHGELIAFLRTDGCLLPSINNAIHKAFTAVRERKPSAAVGAASRQEQFALTNFGDLRYTGWGGGVPVMVAGEVVGAIGVSGLPEADDIELAAMGAALFDR
jgi:glc operon protein GlcG